MVHEKGLRPGVRRRVRLAHLTDCHVACDGKATAVLKNRSIEILHDLVDQLLDRAVDAVLLGGDNIDNRGSGERDLDAFVHAIDRLPRAYCVVGNHEAVTSRSGRVTKTQFAARLHGRGISTRRFNFWTVVGDVRVIGIDTTVIGATGGRVSPHTLRFLSRCLGEATEPHVVVVGHHLLRRTWAPHHLARWDEEYLVSNWEQVVALLLQYPNVRAYLCGHHHASSIQRIGPDGASHGPDTSDASNVSNGFYHILTPSPAAYPHVARILEFDDSGIHVSALRPRLTGLMEAGLAAVLSGRKARRFATVSDTDGFLRYIAGRPDENDVFLPHNAGPSSVSFANLATSVVSARPQDAASRGGGGGGGGSVSAVTQPAVMSAACDGGMFDPDTEFHDP
ncbi:MAG: metallophosphoesterase [Deltaproteobacteria bacterium]|nr:metallophosphoesterase [Deltaproteobacteria bacterium]